MFKWLEKLIAAYEGDSNMQTSYVNKDSKTFVTGHTTLELKSKTTKKVEQTTKAARTVFKHYLKNPDGLLEYIEDNGTPVVKLAFANKLLALIGEVEGFLTPISGFKAFFLITMINLLSDKKMAYTSKTQPMFVLRDESVNVYFMGHQFHHWVGYLNELPGYEDSTTEKFRHVWSISASEEKMNELSLDEILSLKEAIARDVEAIQFIEDIARECISAKKVHNQLAQGNSASI